jgi:glutaredoxin
VPNVRLFTREGCALCDRALAAVERALTSLLGAPRLAFAPCTCGPTSVVRRVEYREGSVLQVIDVDAEPDLRKRFGFEVPVVEIDGGPTFSLEIDERALGDALRASAAREVAA